MISLRTWANAGRLSVRSLFLILAAANVAAAQAVTTLRVGVPPTPGDSQSYESLSTSQIDLALTNLLGGQYPANYTSNKAEAAFQSLASLKQDLVNDVRAAILADARVRRVYHVNVSFNPVKARLAQAGTSVRLDLGDIDFDAAVELRTQGGFIGSVFCPTPDVDFEIQDLSATASYNVYTGQVGNFDSPYDSLSVDISCGGILGFVGDILVDLFVSDPNGLAADAIQDAVADINGIANMETLFSVRGFLEALLDSDLLSSADANRLLETIDEIVMQTNLDTGLVLDIVLDDGVNNTITFLASHKPPQFGQGGAPSPNTRSLAVYLPDQATSVDVYRRPTNGGWIYLTSLTQNATVTMPHNRFYAEITAVAHSGLISGLKSTDNPSIYFWDPISDGGGRK